MILHKFIPKNETEDLLLSLPKDFERDIEQTQKKRQGPLEFKLTQPKETFSYRPSILPGDDFKKMIPLTSLEVYNSIFNPTEKK